MRDAAIGTGVARTRCSRWMPSEEERAERRAIDAKLDAIARRLADAQAQDEAYRVFRALRSHVDGLAEARMRCGHLRQSLSPVCSRSKVYSLYRTCSGQLLNVPHTERYHLSTGGNKTR